MQVQGKQNSEEETSFPPCFSGIKTDLLVSSGLSSETPSFSSEMHLLLFLHLAGVVSCLAETLSSGEDVATYVASKIDENDVS